MFLDLTLFRSFKKVTSSGSKDVSEVSELHLFLEGKIREVGEESDDNSIIGIGDEGVGDGADETEGFLYTCSFTLVGCNNISLAEVFFSEVKIL